MKILKFIFIIYLSASCTDADEEIIFNTLSSYIGSKSIEMGAVISCAGSDQVSGDILVYYYPEGNVANIRYYETVNLEVDNKDFTAYKRMNVKSEEYFNGYLGVFRKRVDREKWVIVSYEQDNEIKLSNPIRLKHLTKPTIWNKELQIDQSQSTMPKFTWIQSANSDHAIYFQVVSDFQNSLLSGTYTFDNYFQYYNTSNVVLNITNQTPSELAIGDLYKFTMLDVSIDNWVITIIQKTFTVE